MRKSIKGFILLLITLIFLYFVFVNVDFVELAKIFKRFEYKYIIFLIISMTISLSFRALCFKQLIQKTIPDAKLINLIPICLTGAGLNIALPARAGDIFRAYYVGKKHNMDKMKIFGSVMFERLFDVIIIFCLLAVAVFIYHRNPLAMKLCFFAGILLVLGISFAVFFYKNNYIGKFCEFINKKIDSLPFRAFLKNSVDFINKKSLSFFNGFEVIDSPRRVLGAMCASFGIWFFECVNYCIVIQGFGYDIHWSVVLFVIGFIALACMIPSTSIFIGPYQVAVIAAFSIYGIEKESALAISVLEQSIVTIYLLTIAFLFLVKNNISFGKLKKDITEKFE
ncbi:flippase-like domain-containing protein [bacterium]|nr:flippase-like domain-containing protein [bacterium]